MVPAALQCFCRGGNGGGGGCLSSEVNIQHIALERQVGGVACAAMLDVNGGK